MTEEMNLAKVQGVGKRDGRTPQDIPDGYISWDEHYRAWGEYSRTHHGQSAERIESRGGFSYEELRRYLGHNPISWVPRDMERYGTFVRAKADLFDPEELAQEASITGPVNHIWYGTGTVQICSTDNEVPEMPIYFDFEDVPNCPKCFHKLVNWLEKWGELGR